MSLILDALNRSQRERAAAELTDMPAPSPPDPSLTGNPWLVRGLAVALLCSLMALAWLMFERADPLPAAVPAASPAAAGAAAPPREPRTATVRRATESTPPAVERRRAGRSVAEDAVTFPPESAPALMAAPEAPPATPPAVAALYAAPGAGAAPPAANADLSGSKATGARDVVGQAAATAAPGVQSPPTLDVERVVSRAQQELARDPLPAHPAPLLAELSQQQKNQVPSLLYLRHDYASGAGRSSVLINRRELRVGDSVSGVRVEEIHPDFVVLNYQGTVFRLRALNSWVNL